MTTNLSPALERCLFAHRRLCERLGRPPCCRELADEQGGLAKETVYRAIEKLAVRGHQLKLSVGERQYPSQRKVRASLRAERDQIADLLRLADKLVSRYGHPDDAEWSDFRKRAAPYLGERQGRVA